jgi:hypothetical protein
MQQRICISVFNMEASVSSVNSHILMAVQYSTDIHCFILVLLMSEIWSQNLFKIDSVKRTVNSYMKFTQLCWFLSKDHLPFFKSLNPAECEST